MAIEIISKLQHGGLGYALKILQEALETNLVNKSELRSESEFQNEFRNKGPEKLERGFAGDQRGNSAQTLCLEGCQVWHPSRTERQDSTESRFLRDQTSFRKSDLSPMNGVAGNPTRNFEHRIDALRSPNTRGVDNEHHIHKRPWCVVTPISHPPLYLPGLPNIFRQSAAEGRLRWIQCTEALVPISCQMLLESGLCDGVFLMGHDVFSKAVPSAIWSRRWQLASRKGGTEFIWYHCEMHYTIGFDTKLVWHKKNEFEVIKNRSTSHRDRLQFAQSYYALNQGVEYEKVRA